MHRRNLTGLSIITCLLLLLLPSMQALADAPVAVDDDYATDANNTLTVAAPGVLDNDSDAEDDPLTAELVTDVSDGTLALNPDGSFTYDPDMNFKGTDSFTYSALGGGEVSNTATVTITVDNTAPVGVDDAYEVLENNTLTVAAPDAARIYTAGEKEYEHKNKVLKEGLPVNPELQEELLYLQKELDITGYDFGF